MGLLLLIALVIVLGGGLIYSKSLEDNKNSDLLEFKENYYLRRAFLNNTESAFFLVLRDKLPRDFTILSKVRLEDLIAVHKNSKERSKYRGYVRSRHVDFVVCKTFSRLEPLLVIELDGKSHLSEKAREADQRKDLICDSVGIKLLRVQVGEDFAAVANSVCSELGVPTT